MNFYWIQGIECSTKIKNLYKTKNKKDIIDMVYNDLIKNFKRKYNYNGFLFLETKNKTTYKFEQNTLVNVLNIKPLGNDEIIKNLKNQDIIIPQTILNKFLNINKDKLLEIIHLFLDNPIILRRNREYVYVENIFSEVILVIDYHNYMIDDLTTLKNESIDDNSLIIENDKIKFGNDSVSLNKDDFISQLDYLQSYNYNIDKFKDNIKNNCEEIISNNTLKNTFDVITNKFIFTTMNYNIISIKTKEGTPLPTAIKNRKKNTNISIDELVEENYPLIKTYKTCISIKDVYKNYIKAKEYIEKMGISIRVITKFILNNNLRELFEYLCNDIVYYGEILYDNYIESEMIIKTDRFYYIIKNNVICNIKTLRKDELPECSISFKPYKENTIIKKCILDLDIKDKVRTFISYKTINELKINAHAKERFYERISKNDNILDKENIIKKDIYKNGEVILGTYYLNTKLIKGLKNVYVLNNEEIISIWKINEFIDSLNNRYFLQIDTLNDNKEVKIYEEKTI